MTVSVIIPFRPGCAERERVFAWILARWAAAFPTWDVVVSPDDSTGPWRKGIAVARGLRVTSGAVVVIADADSWSPGVVEAVDRVAAGAAWCMPHTRVVRLTEAATLEVLGGGSLEQVAARKAARIGGKAFEQATAGGVIVLRRETALEVPIDPRFAGWGGEDLAHRLALEAVAGRRVRIPGELMHLYHAPAPGRLQGALSAASDRLRVRYAKSVHDVPRMRTLLGEARAACAAALG